MWGKVGGGSEVILVLFQFCRGKATVYHLPFDFCLSTSIPVLTTSTYVVAWPQGDQFLGGGL